MPAALKTLIDTYYTTCGYFTAHMSQASNYFYDCHVQAEALGFLGLANSLELAAYQIGYAGAHFTSDLPSLRNDMRTVLYWINTNWPTGGTVDMAAILNAMLAAKYADLQQFIGIEDAFRSALWDQPFNAEFYAALARGFRP